MNDHTRATCRHCRKTIEFAAVLAYWFHTATQSVYCDMGGVLRAEPRTIPVPCGVMARRAEEPCPLPRGHRGSHADPRATFTCDGCGNVRRGQPSCEDPTHELGFCFLCCLPPKYGESDAP